MNSTFSRLETFAPFILRLGIAFVFVWFGTNEVMNPSAWASLIPEWVVNLFGIKATTFVYLNGSAELLLSLLLALDVWTRWVALLLFLHLASIVFDLGLTAVGVRDIGLSIATLAIALSPRVVESYSERRAVESKENMTYTS